MENREIARRLRGFEAVWRRVKSAEGGAAPSAERQTPPLMPRRRCRNRCRGTDR